MKFLLSLQVPTPENSQTHSKKLFKCVLPSCGLALKGLRILLVNKGKSTESYGFAKTSFFTQWY